MNTALIDFINCETGENIELEVPLGITANELIIALNKAYGLGMDIDNIFNCSLVSEQPIAFLRGNRLLNDFGIRNGSKIICKRK